MNKNSFFLLILCPLLSGCIGSQIWGSSAYMGENFPDIRMVPSRQKATESRGLHGEDEKTSRGNELKKLEQEREQLRARDQALREKAFQPPN